MKFTMRFKNKGSSDYSSWPEEIERDDIKSYEEARRYAEEILADWNQDFPNKQRELISLEIDETTIGAKKEHSWVKVSLITEVGGYDRMECENCGITGKRYGLDHVTRDKKYQKPVFARCDTAQEKLGIREKPVKVPVKEEIEEKTYPQWEIEKEYPSPFKPPVTVFDNELITLRQMVDLTTGKIKIFCRKCNAISLEHESDFGTDEEGIPDQVIDIYSCKRCGHAWLIVS